MLLHYLGKLKIRNFALFMYVKHVSDVTFYHLSNRYLLNVIKQVQGLTMCKISTFFSFCSFTVLNRFKALQLSKVGPWSDFWPDIIDTAVDQ